MAEAQSSPPCTAPASPQENTSCPGDSHRGTVTPPGPPPRGMWPLRGEERGQRALLAGTARRGDTALTCQVEVPDGRVGSQRGHHGGAEAAQVVLGAVHLPPRRPQIVLVAQRRRRLHELDLRGTGARRVPGDPLGHPRPGGHAPCPAGAGSAAGPGPAAAGRCSSCSAGSRGRAAAGGSRPTPRTTRSVPWSGWSCRTCLGAATAVTPPWG